jgi:hypothetical protein
MMLRSIISTAQPAILILDASHDIGISDIPPDPPFKRGFYPKNSPLEGGQGGVAKSTGGFWIGS